MLIKKIIVFLIIFILFFPSISLNVFSQTVTDNSDSNNNLGLIWRLLKLRFNLGFLEALSLGRYFYRQLRPPVAIQSYPDSVDLRYLNETTFNIGGKNAITLEWEPMVKVAGSWSFAWFNPRTIYSFEFVPPEDAPGDVWNVQFDPEELVMDTNKENLVWPGAEKPFRTNVTIMLKPSLDPNYPSQDVVLKVNIVRTEVLDYLRILSGSPKWVKNNLQEYKDKMNAMDPEAYQFWSYPINTFMWNRVSRRVFFLSNLQFPPVDSWVDSTVEILIRVNKYHLADIIPPLPQDIQPYEVKSIPVTIINLGSHIDTFNFRVKTTDKNMVVTPPPALTLKPGEEAQALLGVAAPKTFLSVGATTSVFLEAYSVNDPNSVFSNTVILSTVGIYAAASPTYNFALLLITLFVIAAIIFYFIKKRREKISIKPDKPWDIPAEKENLEKLKVKDKQKYDDTLKMMKDEYSSAMLWYKYYCDASLKKKKVPRKKFEIKINFKKLTDGFGKIKIARKKSKKQKLKVKEEKLKVKKEKIPKKKPISEPKKIEEIKPEKIIKKEKIVDKKAELERIRRERILSKIRRAQEKQIRKTGD